VIACFILTFVQYILFVYIISISLALVVFSNNFYILLVLFIPKMFCHRFLMPCDIGMKCEFACPLVHVLSMHP
jgi:hypothetical protein